MSVWWEVVNMRKLISANFFRLFRDKTFWFCVGAMFIYAVAYMLNGVRQATASLAVYHYTFTLDDYYFHFAVVIGIFCALICSMFLGTEYSDGTIRNKLVVGHTRADIYLASLTVTFLATLLVMAVWLIGALVGVPALGVWQMDIPHLLECLVIAVLAVAVFSSIFTFISMLSANKAVTVAVSIFVFLGLLILASMIYNGLQQPELASSVEMTQNGMQMSEPQPNPEYIGGAKRTIYEFMMDFLPTGQGILMWQLEIAHPLRMMLSSVLLVVVPTLGGIAVFRRKNLK